MWNSSMDVAIPRLVKANLKLILGKDYEEFLYGSILSYKEALLVKIAKIRSNKPKDKYYITFSKSYNVPNTSIKLKFQSVISLTDYSGSRPQEERAFDPRATYVKITIPAFQGTDHYGFNDLINEAISHVFDKEILGVGK
jgi:hypothetical protein